MLHKETIGVSKTFDLITFLNFELLLKKKIKLHLLNQEVKEFDMRDIDALSQKYFDAKAFNILTLNIDLLLKTCFCTRITKDDSRSNSHFTPFIHPFAFPYATFK
jgi:hypothetical protein